MILVYYLSCVFSGVFFGAVCIGMAGVASLMGSVLQVNRSKSTQSLSTQQHHQVLSNKNCNSLTVMSFYFKAALSIFGMISGPLLGLYLLGMLFRTPNSIVSVFYSWNIQQQPLTSMTHSESICLWLRLHCRED